MMTLSELKNTIQKKIEKHDLLHEHTPANEAIFNQEYVGTFETVETGCVAERYLIPQVGTLQFLLVVKFWTRRKAPYLSRKKREQCTAAKTWSVSMWSTRASGCRAG